ncbi:hypothetical protein Tco_0958237 [Tanacetum coccineum]
MKIKKTYALMTTSGVTSGVLVQVIFGSNGLFLLFDKIGVVLWQILRANSEKFHLFQTHHRGPFSFATSNAASAASRLRRSSFVIMSLNWLDELLPSVLTDVSDLVFLLGRYLPGGRGLASGPNSSSMFTTSTSSSSVKSTGAGAGASRDGNRVVFMLTCSGSRESRDDEDDVHDNSSLDFMVIGSLCEYEGPPIFDDDQYEEESMSVYDIDIEDVIDGEEDNMEDVVVVVNDICSSKIQTTLSVNFSKTVDSNTQELILLKKGNLVEVSILICKNYQEEYLKIAPMDDKLSFKTIKVRDNDSDDSEILNELSEYENAGVLRQERIINSFDGDDLAFQCMIDFRKFTAYLDLFLLMNIISRKAYSTIMVEGLEGTGKNLVAILYHRFCGVGGHRRIYRER